MLSVKHKEAIPRRRREKGDIAGKEKHEHEGKDRKWKLELEDGQRPNPG